VDSLIQLRKWMDIQVGELAAYQRAREVAEQNEKEAQLEAANAAAAYGFLQGTAEAVQREIHKKLSVVVTRCLESVFDDPYTLDIQFERQNTRTEAVIRLLRNGNAVSPLTASGGGVVDVVAFALRVTALSLQKAKLRKVLVLDEPFRFVSAEYRPRVRKLIELLAKEMDIQFLIVTHIDDFRIGSVVEIDSIIL